MSAGSNIASVTVRDCRAIAAGVRCRRTRSGYCRAHRIESTSYCGVCTATMYCTPLAGSSQKDGDDLKLELSDTSRLFATSCSLRPTACARGAVDIEVQARARSRAAATCTSTAPGMSRMRRLSCCATPIIVLACCCRRPATSIGAANAEVQDLAEISAGGRRTACRETSAASARAELRQCNNRVGCA